MSAMSDTLTIGLVLILLFGSTCLYLYTRIQQTETKINLLESILLDLKMTNELKAYPSIPVRGGWGKSLEGAPLAELHMAESSDIPDAHVRPFLDEDDDTSKDQPQEQDQDAASQHSNTSDSPNQVAVKISPNYEAMTVKELHDISKQRSLSGTSGLRRAQLIEALKQSDSMQNNVLESLIGGIAETAEEVNA
jgi:Rho termination factor, N-terminal domain